MVSKKPIEATDYIFQSLQFASDMSEQLAMKTFVIKCKYMIKIFKSYLEAIYSY